MEGKIHRVTYNIVSQEVVLHLKDGETKTVPMSEKEWEELIKGNVIENFSKFLDEK